MRNPFHQRLKLGLTLLGLAGLLIGLFLTISRPAAAQEGDDLERIPALHPTFPLLDQDGNNVLDSGNPISTMQTCGSCHDAEFIAGHSSHADVGLSEFGTAGTHAWDNSSGLFGNWNPITYRYLSSADDAHWDMTTVEWIRTFGTRHVGGGPATTSREGLPLTALAPDADGVEASIVDPESGDVLPWDWSESGTVEMNCFLCHTPDPDNVTRTAELQAGRFAWANTATLAATGIVTQSGDGWRYNRDAFDAEGHVALSALPVQDPTSLNCAQCHGLVQVDAQTPLLLESCSPDQWSTITTGQVFSPQRISDSGLNLTQKETLDRTWDVHAERVVNCTDCHYSLNNPVYYQEDEGSRPEHLVFDPRRIDLGEYLKRPLHEFAKGQSAQGALADHYDNSLRRCESCHDAANSHSWLPYVERHTAAVACESCHIPTMYAPARESIDWTVLTPDGYAATTCRGVANPGETFGTALISGFDPVLLPRENADGTTQLAPFNLISSWYWVYGDPRRPVPLRNLEAAWFAGDGVYHPAILDAFDANGDGELDTAELVIDSDAKEALITAQLEATGIADPRIEGEVQPYSINHTVTAGDWATRECSDCHSETSRITQPISLGGKTPGGVTPTLLSTGGTQFTGKLESTGGALFYRPTSGLENDSDSGLYILGHDSVYWVDWFGILALLGTVLAVFVHAGLRVVAARRNPPASHNVEEVYMYTVYERFWHWLQTLVIFGLLFTGLIIHRPDKFGIFSFSYVVQVHNILAFILVANAALSAFYHLASGEIQQFIPRPRGFFDQIFVQAKYYIQGIFRNDPHPFEKTPERKLNPLQQVTYFGLLNVLLPLQVLTGILMWGVQRWPNVADFFGGLGGLAPFHTLISWLLAAFIVAHVYLTTTGHTATAGIKSMVIGWDEVEVHPSTQSGD